MAPYGVKHDLTPDLLIMLNCIHATCAGTDVLPGCMNVDDFTNPRSKTRTTGALYLSISNQKRRSKTV